MGRKAKFVRSVGMGAEAREIPFSLSPFKGFWRFQAMHNGKYVRVMTDIPDSEPAEKAAYSSKINQTLIKVFHPANAPKAKPSTWADLIDSLRLALTVNNNRHDTFVSYEKCIKNVSRILPEATGPHAITPDLAERFKTLFISTPYTRGKSGIKRFRTPTTFNSALRQLRAVWGNWLKPCPKQNPWELVEYAKTDRKNPKAPNEEHVLEFFQWVKAKYFPIAHTFFVVKAVCGCRLADLCELKADQWDGVTLHFRADQTKNRAARRFPLGVEVGKLLDSVKGSDYLWDRYPVQCRDWLKERGQPSHRLHTKFDTMTFYYAMETIVRDWNKAHPTKKLTTHGLRRRAVTLAYKRDMTTNQIADAFGMTALNVERSYLDRSGQVPAATLAKAAEATTPPL